MTVQEIKKIVESEIEHLNATKHGVATNRYYKIGKINGMLKGFQIAGFITQQEVLKIIDETDAWI